LAALPARTGNLQIVLIGRPQVEQTIRQEDFRELRDRIGGHYYHLRALDENDIGKYIASRVKVALESSESGPVFTDEALAAIGCYARGIPRAINLLCECALIRGYALRQRMISPAIVHQVAEQCSRDAALQKSQLCSAEEQSRELLQAVTVLAEFHAALKGLRTEDGRRRCDGGKRPRDQMRRPDGSRD